MPMRLDLFVKLLYQLNTKIIPVGIKYSVRDLLLTSITMRVFRNKDRLKFH